MPEQQINMESSIFWSIFLKVYLQICCLALSLLSKGNEEPRSCWSGEVYQGPTNSSEATNVAGIGEDEQGRYLMHRHPVPMLSLGPSISRVWTCHIPPYLHPRNCPLLCGYTRSGYVVAGEVWICRSSGPEWADSWPKENCWVGCFQPL